MIDRYSSKEMKALWSEQNRFNKFLDVEKANCIAYCKLGVIPESDLKKILDNASFNYLRVKEIEKETKHDVIAFTRAVSESLGEEKKWIHYSLTSTDVVDTALSILLKEANNRIEEKLNSLANVLYKKANVYKYTKIMGRTHGMHAEVTSFGLKWALWYDELTRDIKRFKDSRSDVEVVKLSGAVGNFADVNPLVEEMVASQLQLGYAKISTQVLSRDRIAFYIMTLSLLASLIEKIATEVRNLSRTEVREVEEFFDKSQKGSSAMPHKRNPIASENMCGCARIMKSYVNVALEDNVLWHERDISHSSAERIMLEDATSLIEYMLTRYTNVLDKLTVFEDRMIKNINLSYGLVFSSRVLTELIGKGLSREEAYDLIQPLAFKALDEEKQFKDILLESKVNGILSLEEIEKCFDDDYYLRNVDAIYQRLNIVKEE